MAQQDDERWNLYYQATSIGQHHGTFDSPYTGPLSFRDYPETDVSLTTTLFFGLRLFKNLRLYFDPEIAGGRGFSGVNGLANPSNGELPRVAAATPKPYIARVYLSYDFGFGSKKNMSRASRISLAANAPRSVTRSRRADFRSRIFSTTTATRTTRGHSLWHGE